MPIRARNRCRSSARCHRKPRRRRKRATTKPALPGGEPRWLKIICHARESGHPWLALLPKEKWIPAGVYPPAALRADRGTGTTSESLDDPYFTVKCISVVEL